MPLLENLLKLAKLKTVRAKKWLEQKIEEELKKEEKRAKNEQKK